MSPLYFDGETYEPKRDKVRLSKQFERVRDLMLDGQWRTLRQIADELSIPEASASARLRDLRKPRFGSFLVERKGGENGLHRYRVRAARIEILERVAPEPVTPPSEEARLFDPAITHRPLSAYEADVV